MQVQDTSCQKPAPAEYSNLLTPDDNIPLFNQTFLEMKVSAHNRRALFVDSMGYFNAPAEQGLKVRSNYHS